MYTDVAGILDGPTTIDAQREPIREVRNRTARMALEYPPNVTLTNLDNDEESTYWIVGADEADINQGLISISAPLARALIGKSVGDEVVVQLSVGTRRYEIGAIEFK